MWPGLLQFNHTSFTFLFEPLWRSSFFFPFSFVTYFYFYHLPACSQKIQELLFHFICHFLELEDPIQFLSDYEVVLETSHPFWYFKVCLKSLHDGGILSMILETNRLIHLHLVLLKLSLNPHGSILLFHNMPWIHHFLIIKITHKEHLTRNIIIHVFGLKCILNIFCRFVILI